jgi:hypothetical protein
MKKIFKVCYFTYLLSLHPDPYIGILNNLLQFNENCFNMNLRQRFFEKVDLQMETKEVNGYFHTFIPFWGKIFHAFFLLECG